MAAGLGSAALEGLRPVWADLGDPEFLGRLPEAGWRELSRADEAFRSLGLCPPFAFLKGLGPSEEPLEIGREDFEDAGRFDRLLEGVEQGRQVRGWLATAFREARSIRRELAGVEQDILTSASGGRTPSAIELPPTVRSMLATSRSNRTPRWYPALYDFSEALGILTPHTRAQWVERIEVAHIAWRRALLALAYATDGTVEETVLGLALASNLAVRPALGLAAAGPFLFLPSEDLAPGSPRTPVGWFLRLGLEVDLASLRSLVSLGRLEPMERTMALGLRILASRPKDPRAQELRTHTAVMVGMRATDSRREVEALGWVGRIMAATRGLDDGERENLIRAFLTALAYWGREPANPRYRSLEDRREELVEVLRIEIPTFAEEVRRDWPALRGIRPEEGTSPPPAGTPEAPAPGQGPGPQVPVTADTER